MLMLTSSSHRHEGFADVRAASRRVRHLGAKPPDVLPWYMVRSIWGCMWMLDHVRVVGPSRIRWLMSSDSLGARMTPDDTR